MSSKNVEELKAESRALRGTIQEGLAADTSHFSEDEYQLLKFHGTYQQDDRDQRAARKAQNQESRRIASPETLLTKPASIRKSKTSRWRATALLLLNLLMVAHVIQWWIMGRTVSPIEPSETMHTLQRGAINAGFIFFSLALLATLIFGRFVCGWGCHILALQDFCAWMLKKIGLTEAVHAALVHELEREQGKPSLVDLGVQFCRDLRARGNPAKGQPADKAFRDSLYEDA